MFSFILTLHPGLVTTDELVRKYVNPVCFFSHQRHLFKFVVNFYLITTVI